MDSKCMVCKFIQVTPKTSGTMNLWHLRIHHLKLTYGTSMSTTAEPRRATATPPAWRSWRTAPSTRQRPRRLRQNSSGKHGGKPAGKTWVKNGLKMVDIHERWSKKTWKLENPWVKWVNLVEIMVETHGANPWQPWLNKHGGETTYLTVLWFGD